MYIILKILFVILTLFITNNILTKSSYDVCRVTRKGVEYMGKMSESKSGQICEYWESDIKSHFDLMDHNFPDGSRRAARNYCRNPNNSSGGPWCYIRSESGEKENCTVPVCCGEDNCKSTGPGMEYVGGIQKSVYDNECLHWAATSKKLGEIENMLPDGNIMLAGKSCRNPSGIASGPWCYVFSGDVGEHEKEETWIQEPCNIPTCFDLQYITVVQNEADTDNDIENYYTYFTSIGNETEEITFSIMLWNPENWHDGEIRIALSVMPIPVRGDQLRKWDIGYEVILRNLKVGATPSNNEEESWEDRPTLLSGIHWSEMKLSWRNGFISLIAPNKEKPYFIHEIKRQEKGIISQQNSPITHISIMGTMAFWNFSQVENHCQEHVTTSTKITRYHLLLIESVNKFLEFHLRSKGNCIIEFKISPAQQYPRVQLSIHAQSGKTTIYLYSNTQTRLLSTAILTNSLTYWKWNDYSISISGYRFQLLLNTKKGLETIFDVNDAIFHAIRWYAIGSTSTSHWTIFCRPSQIEYEAMPPECSVSDMEIEYEGHQWITGSGLACLPWNADNLNNIEHMQFPDNSITAAFNYCRNPVNDINGTFCFALDIQSEEIKIIKESCELRKCRFKDCRIAGTSNDFMGQLSTTISGRECQAWTSNSPHAVDKSLLNDDLFPERSVIKANNYCRDPSHTVGGPWCYTVDPGVNQDLCDVPDCYKPIQCTVITRMATRRKIFLVPQWRAHGLPMWVKMWNPDVPTALIINIYPQDGRYLYKLILGDDENENIKLYYFTETGEEKLLKQKTHSHFLLSGRWVGFKIQFQNDEINLSFEDSPNPFFIWKKGDNEDLPAVNAMYFSYEAKNKYDEGSIGLNFPCDVCQTEICEKELSHYSVYYPMNIWTDNSSLIVNNITFYARGSGSFTVNFYAIPTKLPIGKLVIDDTSDEDAMEFHFVGRRFLYRVALKYKKSQAIVNDYWSEVTLTTDGNNGSLILNGTTFMTWNYPRIPVMYYFSIQCSSRITWVVNCQPPLIDGNPINGGWSPWSSWECSVSCGGGRGIRRRKCNNPEPSMFGNTCEGRPSETGTCNEQACGEVTIATVNLVRKYLAQHANNIYIFVHESVDLQCNPELLSIIKRESPKSIIYWNKNGVKVTKGLSLENMTPDHFKFQINNANTSFSGVYACTIIKTEEEQEIIDVFAVNVISRGYTKKCRIGEKLILRANTFVLSNVYSNIRMTWFNNGKTYKEYDITDLRLIEEETIYPVRWEHEGEWHSVIYQDQLGLLWNTSWYKVHVKKKASWATYLLGEDLLKGKFGSNEIIIYISVALIFTTVTAVAIGITVFIIRLQNYFKKQQEKK